MHDALSWIINNINIIHIISDKVIIPQQKEKK